MCRFITVQLAIEYKVDPLNINSIDELLLKIDQKDLEMQQEGIEELDYDSDMSDDDSVVVNTNEMINHDMDMDNQMSYRIVNDIVQELVK